VATRACLKHPRRYFYRSTMPRLLETAPTDRLPLLDQLLVDGDGTTEPGMPWVADFPKLITMGVGLSTSTCSRERISHSRRMRQSHARSWPHRLAASLRRRKWAGFITATIAPLPNRRSTSPSSPCPNASTADRRARSSCVRRLLPGSLRQTPDSPARRAAPPITMQATCATGIAVQGTHVD
jgi:hypothetical protein